MDSKVKNLSGEKEEKSSPETKTNPWGKGRPPSAIAPDIKKQRVLLKEKKNKQIEITKKLDLFLEEFLKNGGNATEAALKVFNTTSRTVAATLGSRYLKQAKDLARVYLETKGTTYGSMLTFAADKMQKSKNPDWWDRLMSITGYGDFMTKSKGASSPGIIQIINAQKDMIQDYVEGEIVDEETDTE